MIAIKKTNNYLTFSIDEIGTENLNSLIKDSFKVSNKLSIEECFDFDEKPSYSTQVPYPSGYVQDRYVYYITHSLANYVLTETEKEDSFDMFFCQYVCWDFYDNNTLILSINIVQGIVSVNSDAIDLTEYNNYLEGDFGYE
jgi:hypothetical protein